MDGIWIDRNGTRYGPYTAEEFLAYLASGHIVASDRARVGERGAFEPVPSLAARLGAKAGRAMAPVAPSAANEAAQPVPERRPAQPGDRLRRGCRDPPASGAVPAPTRSTPSWSQSCWSCSRCSPRASSPARRSAT